MLKTMARRVCILLAAAALFAPGCKDQDFNWWKKSPGEAGADEAPTPQQREIERLREENRGLNERLTEGKNRSALLAKKVKQQEFINDQLRRQLQAVGDAPLQRDNYKARCARLEQHIEELEAQLAEFMKLRTSSSTRPAGE